MCEYNYTKIGNYIKYVRVVSIHALTHKRRRFLLRVPALATSKVDPRASSKGKKPRIEMGPGPLSSVLLCISCTRLYLSLASSLNPIICCFPPSHINLQVFLRKKGVPCCNFAPQKRTFLVLSILWTSSHAKKWATNSSLSQAREGDREGTFSSQDCLNCFFFLPGRRTIG